MAVQVWPSSQRTPIAHEQSAILSRNTNITGIALKCSQEMPFAVSPTELRKVLLIITLLSDISWLINRVISDGKQY